MERNKVIAQLASSLGRRDEVPNQELAGKIVESKDKQAVKVLVELLKEKKKPLQNDAIKTLYEVGGRDPQLIAPYFDDFMELLDHKNNRLQWGGMTAINTIAELTMEAIHKNLVLLVELGETGSVIKKDQLVKILVKLAQMSKYYEESKTQLFLQLQNCPPNQFPKYAEEVFTVVNKEDNSRFATILEKRLEALEKESSKKRIYKLLNKLNKK